MTKIRKTSNLPEWFDIRNYECLNELSDNEIFREVKRRHFLIFLEETPPEQDINRNTSDKPKEFIDLEYKAIQRGEVVIAGLFEKKLKEYYPFSLDPFISKLRELYSDGWNYGDSNGLFFSRDFKGLAPITTSDIDTLHRSSNLYRRNLSQSVDKENIDKLTFNYLNYSVSIDKVSTPVRDVNLHLKISLAEFTDEELINSFKQFLDTARRDFETPQPNKNRERKGDINKIIDYQLIPLLDLILYETKTRTIINRERICRILFDDEELKGAIHLRQTIFPFYKKITSEDYSYVEKNS